MESEWEKEIRELLDSLMRENLEDLLKEITEAPLPFIDYEPTPKARKTRKRGLKRGERPNNPNYTDREEQSNPNQRRSCFFCGRF